MSSQHSEVVHALSRRIQEIEGNWHRRRPRPLSLGIAALDELLPQERLPAGSLVELLPVEGAGAWTLALVMANRVSDAWKMLVVIDGERSFYPPATARWLSLERSIVVRPRTRRDLLLATNLSLRCPAVGAVVGYHEQLRTLDARRLQLAAEAGGGVGFLLRPAGARRAPSFANLRLLLTPVALPAVGRGSRGIRIEVLRCRGQKGGQSLMLEVDHEAGHVRVLSKMAAANPASGAC